MSATNEINKQNAQHSTGPKTEAGKQRSALNALRHGLTSQIIVMPSEDLAAYQRHVTRYADEYHPKGATESDLVQTLADTSWRLNRAAAIETNLHSLAAQGRSPVSADTPAPIQDALAMAACLQAQAKTISALSIHTQRLSRQYDLALTRLREIQKARLDREEAELRDLANILEMHESEGEAFDPQANGFVFTDREIATYRQTRANRELAHKAFQYFHA